MNINNSDPITVMSGRTIINCISLRKVDIWIVMNVIRCPSRVWLMMTDLNHYLLEGWLANSRLVEESITCTKTRKDNQVRLKSRYPYKRKEVEKKSRKMVGLSRVGRREAWVFSEMWKHCSLRDHLRQLRNMPYRVCEEDDESIVDR